MPKAVVSKQPAKGRAHGDKPSPQKELSDEVQSTDEHDTQEVKDTEQHESNVGDLLTSLVSQTKTRKAKESNQLLIEGSREVAEETEASVIEWVETYPELWNSKHKDFKNKSRRDRLWQDKATELKISVEKLKKWYTGLRDSNTRLLKVKSGAPRKSFTHREQWIMDKFRFLSTVVRHRRAPLTSVQQALAKAHGELEMAQKFATENKIAIKILDDDDDEPIAAKRKKIGYDPSLDCMGKEVEDAKAELAAVRQALAMAEPPTVRSTFLDFVGATCKDASDEQWDEFQYSFMAMKAKWRREDQQKQQQQQQQRQKYSSAPKEFPDRPRFFSPNPPPFHSPSVSQYGMYKQNANRWTMQVQDEHKPWESQSCMDRYTQPQAYDMSNTRSIRQPILASAPASNIVHQAMETSGMCDDFARELGHLGVNLETSKVIEKMNDTLTP